MATAATKEQLLVEMLDDLAAKNHGRPVRITSGKRTVGLFFPFHVSKRSTPPEMTAEEHAELRYALDHIDDAVTPEEMIKMIEEDRDSRRSKP